MAGRSGFNRRALSALATASLHCCNDDSNSTPQSKLVFNVTAGTTYSMMISAKANDGGTLILNAEVPIDKKRRGQLISE